MRIPDHLIKSVGFISRFDPTPDGGAEVFFCGTGFVVGVRMEGDMGLAHIVTAKHVAEAIEPAEAVIAINAKDGAPRFIRTGAARWFYHPTEKDSVDAAVIHFGSAQFDEYDITWIPEDIFATPKRIADYEIGLGDELVVIGLFTEFSGTSQLTPIVRTGNLAMMPKDKIPTKKYGNIEAYLAEGRSIGGLSGSPVFVRNTVNMPVQTKSGKLAQMSGLGQLHLLGLMRSHWDVPPELIKSITGIEAIEAVNMGISVVVPAKKILEILYHPELVEMRKEHWKKFGKNKREQTEDSALKKEFTRADFEAALKKASRKVSGQK